MLKATAPYVIALLLTLMARPSAFPAASKTIVFLGDSLTAGYSLADSAAYPALIERLLAADGLEWRVVNAGISGDTSSGALKRLNWVLKSSPTVVFVALGANDGLRGVPMDHTRRNLAEILRRLEGAGTEAVLSGMQVPTNYGRAYSKQFRSLYPDLAKRHKVPYYPFLLEGVAGRPECNLADGVHPNEKGHEIIAGRLYRFLKPILSAHP